MSSGASCSKVHNRGALREFWVLHQFECLLQLRMMACEGRAHQSEQSRMIGQRIFFDDN